jgi:ATP-binding protein involved in chromosome partitioning
VIVTTPQDIALVDAQKGIEMFRKVDVPILGIIENMAVHICSQCGHREHIFGEHGGERIAADYGVPLLASLPLALSIREQTDAGTPTVIAEPDSAVTAIYLEAAAAVQAALAGQGSGGGVVRQFPEIKISDD